MLCFDDMLSATISCHSVTCMSLSYKLINNPFRKTIEIHVHVYTQKIIQITLSLISCKVRLVIQTCRYPQI